MDYQEAAITMLSAASAAISANYQVIGDGFDFNEDHLAINQPVIVVAVLGEYSQSYNSATGSFQCVLAEPMDSNLTNAQNVKAVANSVYAIMNAFRGLPWQAGYLDEARCSASASDLQICGNSYGQTLTNIRLATFTIDWGLSE